MKKTIFYILLILPFLFPSFSANSAVDLRPIKVKPPSSNTLKNGQHINAFLELTPKKIRQQTG